MTRFLGRTDGQTDGRSDCTPRPAFAFGDAGKNSQCSILLNHRRVLMHIEVVHSYK